MLSRLLIKNYALIDNLDISFDQHLNIVTGETGSGKSIILGALSLILGQRAESKYFFNQQNKCIVEGFFDVKNYDFADFFSENDLDYQDETTLRREIAVDGKSRSFINDTPVTLSVLKALGQQLIEVHSQHATLEMNDEKFQLLVLDVVAGHQTLVKDYQSVFHSYQKKRKQYKALLAESEKAKADQDYFQFLYDELENSNLQPGEQEQLENELNCLTHAEEIKRSLFEAVNLIASSEEAGLNQLQDAASQLQAIINYNTSVSSLLERLRSCNIELKDIAYELESLEQNTNFDESRTTEINERLSEIFALEKKHRVNTVEELIHLKDELSGKLNAILFTEEDLITLESDLKKEKAELLTQANLISENRKQSIPIIENHVISVLSELGMPNAQIKIQQIKQEDEQLAASGLDQISFLFNANKGHRLNELNKVASGGELSRLMLSIKSLIAKKTALPTIIFDEIDTGVSGEVANRVGVIMQGLSKALQVIAITHLPQMASKGDAHYFVYKETVDDFTYTQIKRLSDEERVIEIAKMLSGEKPGVSAIQNAKELLAQNTHG